jgi:Na+/H+-dicarboxylate symporter
MGVTAFAVVLFTGLLIPFYHLNFAKTASAASSFDDLYELIMNIVPRNIILPFSENNTIQIIILALILGSIILNLDNRVNGLRSTITDLHVVFMNATEAVCSFLPLFVLTSLTKLFWQNGFGTFAQLWKPIVAAVVVEYSFVFVLSVFLGFRYKINPFKLLKKMTPSFLVGISTGSSLAAYTKGMEVNKNGLGISDDYSRLAYPLGISLYVATYAPLYIAITYYMAEIYQTPTSLIWFGTVALICMILAYASPQVSGGVLICLGILMTQLNIPSEGIAIAGTISLALDFFSTGAKVLGQHLEMLQQAEHLGMLDKEILRR